MRRASCFLALLLALAGCGGGGDEGGRSAPPKQTKRSSRPPICSELEVTTVGRVADPGEDELSGLVASRRQKGVLWAIEDSGNAPEVIALDEQGTTLGRFTVPGAENIDWEDVAVAGGDLYIADIGDNDEKRDSVAVYRVPEPDVSTGGGQTAPPVRLELRYPDGPHDAEALLVDPRRRGITIVTKDLLGVARVYSSPPDGGTLGSVDGSDLDLGGPVTGAGLSPDGRTVALRTYTSVYAWARRRGEKLTSTLLRPPCSSPTRLREGQGEAIAVLRGGRSFLTVSEGVNPAVLRYKAS